jgi:nucleotide-binding universal stress UspA family protein
MLKRILVALSGTRFTPVAVTWAVELALKTGSSVTGVTVTDTKYLHDVGPVPLGGSAAVHALEEHRVAVTEERIEEEIARFERTCAEASVAYVVARESGDPFQLLLGLWRYHDLTIIGLRGLFEYGVVRKPDDQVIQLMSHGVRPILAVSPEYHPVNRVLVAYSGTLESAMAMKRFAQLRLWPDAAVKIVCFGFEDAEAMPLLIDATAYLRAHGFDPEAESLPGRANQGLLAHAEDWGADLVVMGSTSRGRISKLVLGATSEEVLIHAEVPIFVSQ